MNFRKEDGKIIIEIPSVLSPEVVEKIADEYCDTVNEKIKTYILDVGKVQHLYSSGVRLIVRIQNRVQEIGGKVFVVGANDKVAATFASVNLDKTIPVFAAMIDLEIAMASDDSLS